MTPKLFCPFAICIVGIFGCNDSKIPPSAIASRANVVVETQTPENLTAEASDAASTDEIPSIDQADQPKLPQQETETNPEPAPTNPLPSLDAKPIRMLLPTTLGPLIVDLDVRIGDVSIRAAFQTRMKQVMSDADADDSASVSWDELFDHVASDPQTFGAGANVNSSMRRNMVKLYDRNRNQQADDDEVALFLFRDVGFTGPFRLWGTDYFRRRQAESHLYQALDRDDDGKLQASEIEIAAESILRADENSDQSIDIAEVIDTPVANQDPAWNRRRSSRHGNMAMDLDGYVDWEMLSYSIGQLQGPRPFSLSTNPIEELDRYGDKFFNSDEVKGLVDVDPDLILRVQLSNHTGGGASLETLWAKEELQAVIQSDSADQQVTLADNQLRFTTLITDKRGNRNTIPPAAFAMLDANNDGGLDEAEIPDQIEQQYPFEDFDTNEDGKLTLQEINEGMQPKTPIWAVQLHGRGAEFADPCFAMLDQNHDWTLSTREMNAAPNRLHEIAAEDGTIRPRDIPHTYVIQLVRGDPGTGTPGQSQLFAFSGNLPAKPEPDAPQWARRMDGNRDGEISQLEFPGSRSQFQQLDKNGDGFIEFAELQ